MRLILIRDIFSSKSTTGQLYIDDQFQCYMLEDVDRKLENNGIKIPGQTCIPRGIYQILINYSPHFQRDLPLLANVPQFSGIRIHSGNAPADTEGCLLPGTTRQADWVSNSRAAFDQLYKKIGAALANSEPVSIEIK